MVEVCERRAILERLVEHLPQRAEWRRRLTRELLKQQIDLTIHLAIFVEPYLSAVLDGRKTIESRFGVQKRPPYLRVQSGDLILIKKSGGPVVGVAEANSVEFYQLSPTVLQKLRRKYATALFADDNEFWEARREKHFATLIQLKKPVAVDPFGVPKRDRQGWVTYDSARTDALLGG